MSTTKDTLPRTTELIQTGMDTGLHIGAQVYVSRGGDVAADFAMGQASPGEPGVAGVDMDTDTLMIWLSSGKVITAIAVAQLVEAGLLDLAKPIAHYLPAFAANGKDDITLEHVLTHTGGFRAAPFKFERDNWDEIIDIICDVRPEPRWTPGEKAGYHAHTGWLILGEIIRRITGEDFSHHVREKIFKPAGMSDSWIGMSHDRYLAYGERIGVMMNTYKEDVEPHDYHLPEAIEQPRPSMNACGPIRELGRFYEMLLNGGEIDGNRLLDEATVTQFTSRRREGLFDHTFKRTIDWGLGFIIDSKRYDEGELIPYGYGPYASDETFGHSGYQSSTGFADPAHDLVVAIVFNGTPGEKKHARRMWDTLAAVYEDLGLA